MLISSYLDEIQNIFHIGSSYSASTFIVSDENGRVVFSDDRFAAGDEVSEEYTALFENKDGECAVNSTYIAASLVTDCGWQAIAVCDSPKFVTLTPKSVAVVLAVGAALVIICILCGKVACAQFEGAQLVNPENEFIDPLTGRLNEYGLDEKISELVETSIVGSTYALALICVKDSERLKTTVPPHYWNDVRVKLCETAEEFFSGKRFEIGRVDDKIAVFADYSEFDLFKAHENLERGCKDLCRAFSNFTVGAKGDMKLHVSIGASIYPDHAEEFDSLLELSERALLEAEESGDDSVVIYSPEKHGEDGKAKGAARA
jgi:GGDEF domain-containing protein